jgi:hypothetical protein
MVQLVRHPQTKERDTDRLHLNHRATSRLYSHESKSKTAVNRAIFGTALRDEARPAGRLLFCRLGMGQ